jgi:hypothetical protein
LGVMVMSNNEIESPVRRINAYRMRQAPILFLFEFFAFVVKIPVFFYISSRLNVEFKEVVLNTEPRKG